MTVESISTDSFPAQGTGPNSPLREARVVDLDEYCGLLLARRSIDRVEHGIPRGYRGLRDTRTGQTWLIRESALLSAS